MVTKVSVLMKIQVENYTMCGTPTVSKIEIGTTCALRVALTTI